VRLSIRWRLALWNTLALAGLLVGFAALVYALMAHALYEQADRALLAEADQLRRDDRLAAEPEDRLGHWIDEFHEHEKFFCVVYDAEGRRVLKTPELAEAAVPPAPAGAVEAPRFDDRTLPVIGRQRVLTHRLRAGGREFVVLHLAPLKDVDGELGELLAVLAVAVPVTLAVSALLAYLLARQALRPMDRLRRRTEEVTAERLDRRLPVANPADEVGRLATTINAMIARLERSFAEVRRFTADASHELRTPLTAIRTEAEVALRGSPTEAEYRDLLGSVLEECERLTRLADQLLALAREDAPGTHPPPRPLDLAALVGAVVETVRPLAEARGLSLRHEPGGPLPVRGDEPRLRQVFLNVLDNAVKYTPGGGAVEVRLGRQGDQVRVTVRDTGIGIPPEHLPRVFDRFYRVDKARTRAEGGTGLGLSIARSIVLAHGGDITLDSAPGRGTVCTVSLPCGGNESRGPDTSRIAPSKESER
jgi:heavy metal sensor kinase